jgi:hypothetical protein
MHCVPSWEINHVPIDEPPWSVVNRSSNDRFRCPGCRKPVAWHIHGPTWRPTYTDGATSTAGGRPLGEVQCMHIALRWLHHARRSGVLPATLQAAYL